MGFIELKEGIELSTGLSQDALHIFAAFLIYVAAAGVSGRGFAHPLPWLCVLAAELVNEGLDFRGVPAGQAWDIRASVHDVWNTMALPTLLLGSARLAPWMLHRRRRIEAQTGR